MEVRKMQFTGSRSTYVLSLPKRWIEEMHLKAGDEVYRSLYVFRNLVMVMQNNRVLHEMELKNPSDCLSYRVVAKSIERVADHACSITHKAIKLKVKIAKESL